ncbi:hypothetical protein [Mucilaginibacter antarcticus]|uniref:hypothetical protein n=1 Tax=Mucilaginibacter antarcticus TaxID=1855725 RepID=UPI003634376E
MLATAARVYEEKVTSKSYTFITKSPLNTTNAMRVLLPAQPKKVTVTDAKGIKIAGFKSQWDAASKTSLIGFENNPDGVKVKLEW